MDKNSKLFDVYVAIPYTHPDFLTREARFEVSTAYTAKLYNDNIRAFSPITHSHPLHKYGCRTDFDFYEALDLDIISNCKELHVIMMKGWAESKGVTAELAHARELGMTIKFIRPMSNENTEYRDLENPLRLHFTAELVEFSKEDKEMQLANELGETLLRYHSEVALQNLVETSEEWGLYDDDKFIPEFDGGYEDEH